VSPAGEQLTSNTIYDGEYLKAFFLEALIFIHCHNGYENSTLSQYFNEPNL